jgi:hypothetical protein
MKIEFNGRLAAHIERAWRTEHPSGDLSFEHWCLAVLANSAAKVLQSATAREVRDSLVEEARGDRTDKTEAPEAKGH